MMAFALVLAGVGSVSAAPGSIDGTQTDTTAEVYLSDGKTVDSDFNASGDTTWNLTLQAVPDADAGNLALNVTHDGVEYYAFNGDFGTYDDGDADADNTTNGYYHAFTDDELNRVPMGINENVSFNVTYFNESLSAENRTPTTITVEVQNGDERTVQRITEGQADTDVETLNAPRYRYFSDDYEYNATTVDSSSIGVNGSNTTVIYTLEDDAVRTPFENMTSELSTDGAFTFMQSSVSGDSDEIVPVFLNSAPEWYDASEFGSYAVYSPSQDTLTYELSSENFDGITNADVSASSDVFRVTDLRTVWNMAGGYSGGGVDAITQMVM